MEYYEDYFETVMSLTYGIIRKHISIDEGTPEYKFLLSVAFDLAQRGGLIDILPILHAKDPHRETIFYDAKFNKNPDLRINNVLYEVKKATNPLSNNNIKHAIGKASEQANHVIIISEEPLFLGHLNRASKSNFIDHKDLQIILFRCAGQWTTIERENLLFLYP